MSNQRVVTDSMIGLKMPDYSRISPRVATVLGKNPSPFTGPGTKDRKSVVSSDLNEQPASRDRFDDRSQDARLLAHLAARRDGARQESESVHRTRHQRSEERRVFRSQ